MIDRMRKRRSKNTFKVSNRPKGPDGFRFRIQNDGKVIAWTNKKSLACFIARSLTMVDLLREEKNQNFIDIWIAWLGDLSQTSDYEGLP